MENLTSALLTKHYNYEVEEWTKQGQTVQFDSGTEQRIVGASIPAIDITISYRGLTWNEYEIMRSTYESNHSNTFIVDLNSLIDKRPELMTINSSVWTFKEFAFEVDATSRLFSGRITLLTSVFFNFTEYQSLFTQSSSYTLSASTNQDLIDVMDYAQPYKVELKYYNNALFSNIGESARHIKNKGGLKRAWTVSWLLNESDYIKLLTLYRKKSGIMGEFGMPSFGTNVGIESEYSITDYIENQDDYIAFDGDTDNVSKARFMQDSIQSSKLVNGMWTCTIDIIEVN
jgi:hypothetical protein